MLSHPLSEYATPEMIELWTPEWNVYTERLWWLDIVRYMRDHTRLYDHVPRFEDVFAAYLSVADDVDLDSIRQREEFTHHDVKARIEEFNWRAGLALYLGATHGQTFEPELIHWGMTSADVVDNISLIRMRRAMDHLIEIPARYGKDQVVKRILLEAQDRLPLRGIRGPVGTQQDMLDILGSAEACADLDRYLADEWGFEEVLGPVGQVYPRSLDLMVASAVAMAVQESDNKTPWLTIINGYLTMIASYSGDQWNEGDVSTSAVRRVALPGLFLAADAALSGAKP